MNNNPTENKKHKKNRMYFFAKLAFFLVVVGLMFPNIFTTLKVIQNTNIQIAKQEDQIAKEKLLLEELNNQTPTYEDLVLVEKLARERLGFLRRNEIMFVIVEE